jgi:hypothetical protein
VKTAAYSLGWGGAGRDVGFSFMAEKGRIRRQQEKASLENEGGERPSRSYKLGERIEEKGGQGVGEGAGMT